MKKILLSLGTLASTIAPVAAVVACGNETSDKSPYDLTSKQDASTETQLNFVVKLKNYVSESYIREIKSRIAEDIAAANKDALKYSTIHIEFQDAADATKKEGLLISTNPLTDANKNDLTAIHTFMDTSFATLITSAKANSDLHKFFVEPTSGGSGSDGSGSTGGSGSDGSGSTGGTGTDGSGGTGGTGTDGSGSTGGLPTTPPTNNMLPQEKAMVAEINKSLEIKENGSDITTDFLFNVVGRTQILPDKIIVTIERTTIAATGEVKINKLHDSSNNAISVVSGDTLEISLSLTKNLTVDLTKTTFTLNHGGATSTLTFTSSNDSLNKFALGIYKSNPPMLPLMWDFRDMSNPQDVIDKYLTPILGSTLKTTSLSIKFELELIAEWKFIKISFTTYLTQEISINSGADSIKAGNTTFYIKAYSSSYDPNSDTAPFVFSTDPSTKIALSFTNDVLDDWGIRLSDDQKNALEGKVTQLYKDLFTFP